MAGTAWSVVIKVTQGIPNMTRHWAAGPSFPPACLSTLCKQQSCHLLCIQLCWSATPSSAAALHTDGVAANGAAADGVAADSSSGTEGQQAADATAVTTPALSTNITSAATEHKSHAQAATAAGASNLGHEQAHESSSDAQHADLVTGEEAGSSSEPAASAPVEADSAAHNSDRVGEPSQAPQPDDAAAVSASAVAVAEETEAASASAAVVDGGESEAAAAVADGAATSAASVHDCGQPAARGWPQLSCKQAFAAIQYATGTELDAAQIRAIVALRHSSLTMLQAGLESVVTASLTWSCPSCTAVVTFTWPFFVQHPS